MARAATDSGLEYGTALVVSGGRPAEQVAFEVQVVDFFVSAAEGLGVPKSVAAIYAIVFASAEPVSFADIEERLDISKGSISQGLKALREVGAVREADGEVTSDLGLVSGAEAGQSAPNHKSPITNHSTARGAVRYVPDTEMRRLIERFLEAKVQPQLNTGKERLEELRKMADGFPAAQRQVLESRVKKLEQWHARTRGLLPLVRTFLKLGG